MRWAALAAGLMAALFPPWTLADHEPTKADTAVQIVAPCVEVGKGDHQLRTVYGQAPVKRGYVSGGMVMQLYSTENGSSWSLTLITQEGLECAVMAGEKLKDVPWVLGDQKPSL